MTALPSWADRVADLDAAARAAAQPGRAEQEKQYLKSGLTHLGCPVPALRRIVRGVPVTDRDDLLGLVATMWSEPIHERRMAAVMLLVGHQSLLQPGDIEIVEALARQCLTWALLDELAVHAAGPLLDRHPAGRPDPRPVGGRRRRVDPTSDLARPPRRAPRWRR